MITKNEFWKQIRSGLKEHARSEKLTAAVMKRIRELKDETNEVSTENSNS